MKQRKVVFLDRDGVLNREMGRHTWELNEFEILPGVIPALQFWQAKGFDFVVITNQSGIGLGLYQHEDVALVHNYLLSELRKAGIFVLEVFYCPHHPNHGNCLCRKPGSVMIEKALAKYNIDAASSVMIGDRERDIEAAQAAGVKGILIASNTPLVEVMALI